MEKSIIFNSIFMFISFWGITVFFIWFRPRVEFFWKIVVTLIFLFYLWFFWKEIFSGYLAFKASWYVVFISFLKELLILLFYCSFIFWPIALVKAFYSSSDVSSERLIRVMCVFSLILWVVVSIYIYNNKNIDNFFFKKLLDSIPFIKK